MVLTQDDLDAIADAVLNEMLGAHTTEGSVGAKLNRVGVETVTLRTPVSGTRLELWSGDTWSFTINLNGVDLTAYSVLVFAIKTGRGVTDANATLLVRTDDGLTRVAAAAPTSSANGVLTRTATSFSVTVSMAETKKIVAPGVPAVWGLKGLKDLATDEGDTLASGIVLLWDWIVESTTP